MNKRKRDRLTDELRRFEAHEEEFWARVLGHPLGGDGSDATVVLHG